MSTNENKLPTLSEIKNHIPKECFEKSLLKSLFYMIRDLRLLSTSIYTYDWLSSSLLGLLIYWNVYGFLMWCLFVVGHDCGHGSFSKYPIVNAFCGHLCHTPLLVPFFPWAYSHKMHHQFHNHLIKDKSYPWFSEDEFKNSLPMRVLLKSVITPILSLGTYLYLGYFDGSHINPFGRLFIETNKNEKVKCIISLISVLLFAGILYASFSSFSDFMLVYGGCWIIFSCWLFIVTYMQHHDEDTVVFDDTSWTFMNGAFQTIDRSFGYGIDQFHHNITDCHLVHHLQFTQIPHYHLKKATKSILPTLKNEYKFKKHKFFIFDFWKIFFNTHLTKWSLKKHTVEDLK